MRIELRSRENFDSVNYSVVIQVKVAGKGSQRSRSRSLAYDGHVCI